MARLGLSFLAVFILFATPAAAGDSLHERVTDQARQTELDALNQQMESRPKPPHYSPGATEAERSRERLRQGDALSRPSGEARFNSELGAARRQTHTPARRNGW